MAEGAERVKIPSGYSGLAPSADRSCGTCTMCCKTMTVAELPDKEPGQWCRHCKPGKGCSIYADRPVSCRDFVCLWRGGMLHDSMRPDRTGVVWWIYTDGRTPVLYVDPGRPKAWKEPAQMATLRYYLEQLHPKRCFVVCGRRRWKVEIVLSDMIETELSPL